MEPLADKKMKSLKCKCFEKETCQQKYTNGNTLHNGCLAPVCDAARMEIFDAWKEKNGQKFRYGFALRVHVPQEYWSTQGWTVLLRFNSANVNSGSFQLWNANFFNFFRKESGLEVLIHQKFWTEYDLYDKKSFAIVAENLVSGDIPEVYFWNHREKRHHCFDSQMHSGDRGLGTEFEQAVQDNQNMNNYEDVKVVKISSRGNVRLL